MGYLAKKIIAAINNDDLAAVQAWLAHKNVRINAKTADGMTALFAAADVGNPRIFALLLEKGANINVKYCDRTPLMIMMASWEYINFIDSLTSSSCSGTDTGDIFKYLNFPYLQTWAVMKKEGENISLFDVIKKITLSAPPCC